MARKSAVIALTFLFLFSTASIALAADAAKTPSVSSEFDFEINNQCPGGKGIGYNEHVGRLEKYCPAAAPSSPPSAPPSPASPSPAPASPGGQNPVGLLFRLFTPASQVAASAAKCQESEMLTNYYFTECQGKKNGIEVKGYCVAPRKCHANAYKDEKGKWQTVTKPTQVGSAGGGGVGAGGGCDPAKSKLCAPGTGSSPAAPTSKPGQPGTAAGQSPEAPQPGKPSAANPSIPDSAPGQSPLANQAGQGDSSVSTNNQASQATLGQATEQLGGTGAAAAGGSPVAEAPQSIETVPPASAAAGMSPAVGGGSGAPAGGAGTSGGGGGAIASAQPSPTGGSTFSSSQPTGGSGASPSGGTSGGASAYSGNSPYGGNSPLQGVRNAFSSGAGAVFSAFTSAVTSVVTSVANRSNSGGIAFSPPVNIAMNGSAPTLAQPQVRQQGVVPQEAVPGYRPQFASSQEGSAGLDTGTGKFAGLSQPLLLGADAQPSWTGKARSTMALVMSLPGSESDRVAADTNAGQRGRDVADSAGRSNAGQRPSAQGGGTGTGSGQGGDARTGGVGSSAALGDDRGQGSTGSAEGESFTDTGGGSAFGRALSDIRDRLFTNGINAAVTRVWKFFQDSVGCQITGGCGKGDALVMLGRAPMLLSGDAVVQAFKSYGNDLPSPAVVSQIQLTGEAPVGILERGASALSVVGEGVRALQSALFGEPVPRIVEEIRGMPNNTRPVAQGARPGTFNTPTAERPAQGSAVSQHIVPSVGAPAGGAVVVLVGGGEAGGGEAAAPGTPAPVPDAASSAMPHDTPAVPDATVPFVETSEADATPVARFGVALERSVTRLQSLVSRLAGWFAGLF